MAIKTYNDAPYNDDFNSNSVQFTGAEGKNYLKILFRPGRSVQVRELNQMQSILQSQIDKFGQSIYKEGPILDGKGNLDNNANYIDVLFNGVGSAAPSVIALYIDQVLNINSGGIKASVLHYEALEADDTYRFFIRYDSSIQVNGLNVQEYSVDTTPSTTPNISLAVGNPIVDPSSTETQVVNEGTPFASVIAVGLAAIAKTDAGVYFINGQFVYNPAEELYIAKPAPAQIGDIEYSLNGKIAFIVTDEIVTYVTDPLLLDNANGTPNDTAPGADRYKIDFKLAFLSDTDDDLVTNNAGVYHIDTIPSYITLFTTDLGIVVKPARTEYTQLDRKFATRTFEESGNYCLKPFKLDLREYLNDEDGNRGRFTASDITDLDAIGKIDLDGDPEAIYGERHYIAGLEPSTAYVQGYRVDLQNKKDIQVEKARETQDLSEVYTTLNLGNYVVGTILGASGTDALPDFADQSITYDITINNVTNGTCKVRSLEKISDVGDGIYHLYIYDVSIDSGYLGQATSISTTSFKFGRRSVNGVEQPFELLDSNDNSLLFPLPYNTVNSVTPDYINYKHTFTVSGTSVTITAPSGHVFYSDSTSNYIGINSSGVDAYLTANPIVAAGATSVTLTFNASVTSVIAPIQKSTPVTGTKERTTYTQTETLPSVAFTSGSTIDLDKYDIYDIVSITNTTSAPDLVGAVNITNQFTLDNGQRDNYYQDGKITYTGLDDLNGQELSIVYRYFEWTTLGDFFSANSYGDDVATNINVEYNEIPIYDDAPLADVLDFRPYKYANDARNKLDPDTVVELQDLEVYLPRYDKVVVSTIGDFSVVKGTPSLEPIVPPTPGDSMALYELFVPAYTFDASEITTKYIDNRRYTMKDIGTIERRVKNLEYYTSLSMLEQEATEKKIFTNGGEERFKNGILVDSFVGHNIGNPFDSDYKCAIDPIEGVLRPSYSTNNILFGVESQFQAQETVSFPYTEVPLITQPYASVSESVNPFDIAAWLGVLKLDPSMDEWKETRIRPDVIINSTGAADAIQFLANEANVLGTKWNEWETDWVGVDVQKEKIKIGRSDKGSAATRAANLAAKKALTGSNDWRPLRGSVTTTSTTTAESRDGIRTTMNFREQEENLGERVVDISFVPFIRSRRIELHGEMFKPNTRMYVFFDGIDISEYCSKISTASTPYVTKTESVQTHLNEDAATILTNRAITRDELITDDAGNINVECFIPNNAALRFKTGERTVTLTDSPKNSITEATTYSFATYTASGLIETKESTILSTRIPEFDQQRLSNNRVTSSTDRDVKVRYYDPLAQSFVIGEINTGTSVTKVDLFFQKAHPSIPVTMHLVTVENGIPTQNIVPFSRVVKNPTIDTINVTDDASTATTFTFDAPVYLQPGVEYAVVVMSNSPEYRLWLAETGGDDVNGQGRIDKNPYAGVSFKSQNASTWTPDQNRDFKFTMYRAQYDTAASRTVTFNGLGTSAFTISNFNVFASVLALPQTNIDWTIQFKSNGTVYYINANNTEYLDVPTTIDSADDIVLTAELSTTSEYISPTLDLSRISLLGISNIISPADTSRIVSDDPVGAPGITTDSRVENYDSRIDDGFSYLDDSSVADVQYITRTVTLNDPADRLNIYLLGNRPTSNSDIRVLVKLKTGDEDYDQVLWEEIKPTKNIPVNSDGRYSEVEFDFNADALDAADPRNGIEFTAFAVKIVLTSTDIVNVPTVQDFRAIATFE
jgi:hypothetical protein